MSVLASFAFLGCHQDHVERRTLSPEADPRALIAEAARTKAFFGHQSVGDNIVSGIDSLVRTRGSTWSVSRITNETWPSSPGLWHAALGENEKPKTKIDAFAAALRQWHGDKPRVALLKLCFVDVTAQTDINELLGYYSGVISQLKSDLPEVVFGHATVPLAPRLESTKLAVKRFIGREVPEDSANLARTAYNRRLREMFPSDPIFDLEAVESQRADGTRVTQEVKGLRAYALAPELASDQWGHLNEQGAQAAALALARFIVDAAKRPAPTEKRPTP